MNSFIYLSLHEVEFIIFCKSDKLNAKCDSSFSVEI